MTNTLEIIATYRSERFRFDNANSSVVVANVQLAPQSREIAKVVGIDDSYIAIKGEADDGELEKGITYRFLGHWKDYHNRRYGTVEKQFCFNSFVQHVAHDRKSLIEYLSHAGKDNGVGPRKAAMLVDQFGIDEVLDRCRQPLEVVSAIGVRQDQAERFSNYLIEQKAIESALLDLDSLLAGKGFPKSLPRKLIKEFGNRAAAIIADDPFALMQFHGVGFKKADNLWALLGKPLDDIHRLAMCLWYGMASDTTGSTWFPAKLAVQRLSREIGCEIDFRAAILHGKELAATSDHHYGAIASLRTDSNQQLRSDGQIMWLSEHRNDQREQAIVRSVVSAIAEPRKHALAVHRDEDCQSEYCQVESSRYSIWPYTGSIAKISEHQREQLSAAIGQDNSQIAILTGSPGTGKTYVVAQLLKTVLHYGRVGATDIVVGAPTGKAAVRLTEAFQQAGLPIVARTWHSHLFGLKDNAKLPCKLMISDESSMNDLELMARVFSARPNGAHTLLVGDPYQLPPVGVGAPFRDLIHSESIASGHLTQIERNGGEIVEICARIRDGHRWGDLLNVGNVLCHSAANPDMQIEHLETLVRQHDKWSAQVLVPVNEKSPVCRAILNQRLQRLLNSDGEPVRGTKFRVGDKIVCTKNGWYQVSGQLSQQIDQADISDRGEVRIANGELAEIVNFHPRGFVARLESPQRFIVVTVGKDSGKDAATDGEESTDSPDTSDSLSPGGIKWDLGYALSCHKAQGSEFSFVYIMIDEYPGARTICDASWVMTAISRAKQQCHLIGNAETAQRWCRTWKIGERKTFLKERIVEALISNQLEAI
ncbi:MAG: AAA family ATPase [Pirellulaceae bacterium]|nr:AAA family ATPase [Pirellulaceae bacterium]